jgi:predicted transcriptional regulator
MKSPEEIKKELHQYIDNIEDEETLWMVHEEVADYLKKEKVEDREEDLTEEEISEIKIGLEQIKNGQTVDWNEYSKATLRWRTK